MLRNTLIGILVILVLALLSFTNATPEEARQGSLYRELRENMMSGLSIQPIFRGLPPEAGKYLGIWTPHPEFKYGHPFTTVNMRSGAFFENGCAGTLSNWTLVSKDCVEISEFDVTSFAPGYRCH